MTTTFKTDTTYYARSIGDHNCIYTVKVLERTAHTIKAIVDGTFIKTLRIAIHREVEQVKTHSSYSMACTIGADQLEVLRPDWVNARRPNQMADGGLITKDIALKLGFSFPSVKPKAKRQGGES